ncbi:nodal homolog [Spea bombifrons]|uniref:nodal homolog n=1 Tax=Spea bombifrons TaxID=233779 RepID=UPI002348F282|nr:nodal homolog [Spea bombifrons]
MVVLSAALCFTLTYLVQGLPSFLERGENMVNFPDLGLGSKLFSTFPGKRNPQDIKFPFYMMQLYQTLSNGGHPDFSTHEPPALPDYDTVLNLFAKDCSVKDNHWVLSFDMSSISNTNDLKLAQLRIQLPSGHTSHNVTVKIYHSKEGQEKMYLGTFTTDLSASQSSSWKIVNLTDIIQRYLNQLDRQFYRDYAEAKMKDGRAMDTSSRENVDNAHLPYISTERVMLVVFAKEKPTNNRSGFSSLIKTVESSKYVALEKLTKLPGIKRHRRNRIENHPLFANNVPPKPMEVGKPLCRRVDMMVDFKSIGWDSWIVHPRKYNAYRCEGACPIPLNETFKPTNHAYMKSVVKLHHPERVECPACIPVKMSPLSMLYYEGSDVVLRHHEDMVVEECGCS